MSRNWTPREMHYCDEDFFKNNGKYLHDASIIMTDTNGNKTEVGCKRNLDLYEKYPNLCFLWEVKNVEELHKKGMDEILLYVERIVEKYILEDDINEFNPTVDNDFPKDKVIKKWYMGKLDTNFYYSEKNNELLKDYCYFWNFQKKFAVGDIIRYEVKDFDMIKPQTVEGKIKKITDNAVIFESEESDHMMLDFDIVKDYNIVKV